MSWIKIDTALHDKPEVFSLSELLPLDRDAIVGKLVRVWSWADTHTQSGNATCVTVSLIDAIAHFEGFAVAMEKTGWLCRHEGGFSFPNFDRHNGNTAKSRALTAKRVAECKKRGNASVTVDALPREEKIREEVNTKATTVAKPALVLKKPPKAKYDPTSEPIPKPIDTPEFASAWSDWCEHRVDKNSPLTPLQSRKVLAKFAAWGQPRSIAAIQHTIEGGWIGLVEPNPSPLGGKPKSPQPTSAATPNQEPPHVKAKRERDARRALEAAGATS